MSKWVKGMGSPNPGGRTKAQLAFGKLFRDKTQQGEELADLVLRVARGEEEGMADEKSRRWAIQLAAAYGFGKPTEHVEIATTAEGAKLPDLRGMSLEELEELAAGATGAPRDDEPAGNVH